MGFSNKLFRKKKDDIVVENQSALSWHNKGINLHEIGSYDEAIHCCTKALELDPKMGVAWITKGMILTDLKRHDEAIYCFDKALELDAKTHLVAWFTKGVLQYGLGRDQDAANSFKQFIHLAPDRYEEKIVFARQRIQELQKSSPEKTLETPGDRLRVGMTYDEVVKLLGEPSGVNPGTEMFETGPGGIVVASEETRGQLSRTKYCMWKRPEGRYLLTIEDGKLANIYKKP